MKSQWKLDQEAAARERRLRARDRNARDPSEPADLQDMWGSVKDIANGVVGLFFAALFLGVLAIIVFNPVILLGLLGVAAFMLCVAGVEFWLIKRRGRRARRDG